MHEGLPQLLIYIYKNIQGATSASCDLSPHNLLQILGRRFAHAFVSAALASSSRHPRVGGFMGIWENLQKKKNI